MAGSILASPSADPALLAADPALAEGGRAIAPVDQGWETWRRFRRHRLAVVSAVVLGLIVLGVLLGPWLWPVAIDDIDFAAMLQGPTSGAHPFGTDDLGQDLLARMISWRPHLARGRVRGHDGRDLRRHRGRLISRACRGACSIPILMWVTDLFLSLPQLPLLLLIIYLFRDQLKAVFGVEGGVFVMIVAVIGGLRWMPVARLVRAQFLSLREKEFVEAARSQGATTWHQVVRHILPNALGPGHRGRHDRGLVRDHRGIDALLPRPRLPARHPDLGPHPVRRQGPPRRRARTGRSVPGRGDLPHRSVDQLHRRRPARRARSAAGDLMDAIVMPSRPLDLPVSSRWRGPEEEQARP